MAKTKRKLPKKANGYQWFRNPKTFRTQKVEMQAFELINENGFAASNRLSVRSNHTSKSNGLPTAWDDQYFAAWSEIDFAGVRFADLKDRLNS